MDMFCLYQMKDEPQNERFLYQSYADLLAQGAAVTVDRYDKVYQGIPAAAMTATSVRRELAQKPRHALTARAMGVGDVITLIQDGQTACYYLDEIGMIPFQGFFAAQASSVALLTSETSGYLIRGKPDGWRVADTTTVDGHVFFLMESEKYGRRVTGVILDAQGSVIVDNVKNEFDPAAIRQIQEHIHPAEAPAVRTQIPERKPGEFYWRFFENGTYERSFGSEVSNEQNYNMIDGLNNNRNIKKGERASVRERLRRKQALLHGCALHNDERTKE